MQPSAIMAMVPKPYSSAPSMPQITSQPLLKPPSTRRSARSRNLFSINTDALPLAPTRATSVLNRAQRRGTRAATRNLDDISICFATQPRPSQSRFPLPTSPIPAPWVNLVQVKISCAGLQSNRYRGGGGEISVTPGFVRRNMAM